MHYSAAIFHEILIARHYVIDLKYLENKQFYICRVGNKSR